MDVVVTVPKNFTWSGAPGKRGFAAWQAEGDAPNTPWSGTLWEYTTWGTQPTILPGERVYVVCEGHLVGYAPLVRLDFEERHNRLGVVIFIRGGNAVAVTLPEVIRGFRGWRYRWWRREEEVLDHVDRAQTKLATLL